MTLTLEIPAGLAARIASLPPEKRDALSVELADVIEEILDNAERPDDALTPEVVASIRRGLADSDAGRVTDGDVFFARLFARVGLPAPEPLNE